MVANLGELVKKEASYLVAAAAFVATRTADLVTTYLPLSLLDRIEEGSGHQAETNPILRMLMENAGTAEGIMIWGGVTVPLTLGIGYFVNYVSGEKKIGNLVLYLNAIGATHAAASNYQIYEVLQSAGLQ